MISLGGTERDTLSGITCSKLTMETLEQKCEICHCRHFGVFIVNFEHISHLCSSVSIVNFEQVDGGWDK